MSNMMGLPRIVVNVLVIAVLVMGAYFVLFGDEPVLRSNNVNAEIAAACREDAPAMARLWAQRRDDPLIRAVAVDKVAVDEVLWAALPHDDKVRLGILAYWMGERLCASSAIATARRKARLSTAIGATESREAVLGAAPNFSATG